MEHPQKKVEKKESRHRLTRRTRSMIFLGVAVAVATALVLLLPTIRSRFPIPVSADLKANLSYQMLDTGDKNVLDTITVSHSDGETYTLQYRNEKLYLQQADGTSDLVNESYTDDIVSSATEISIEDTVTDDESQVDANLADMGLKPPEITVKVAYTTGREVELQIGGKVPETGYYYYRWSGSNGVYMCDAGIHDAFAYTAQNLLPVEQPALVPALIDRLSIDTRAAGLMDCAFVSDGTGTYLGTLKQPYTYPMDSEAVTSLMNALKNFRLGTLMDTVTPTNRADYGFDDPTAVVEVHQQQGMTTRTDADGVVQSVQSEEQSIHLTFGAADGDYFYFCEYAGKCYRVSSFLMTALLEAKANDMLSHAPADMGTDSLSSVAVQLGAGTLDIKAVYTQKVTENNEVEKDDKGNVVYDIAATCNGQTITADAFTSLVERLKEMTVSGSLGESQVPAGTPRWQMTLTTTGGQSRTLAAYPMDTFNDILAVDGVALQYLNAEAIQIALGELYPN